MKPQDYPAKRYSFENYNTKHRLLTYWHQWSEILALEPNTVLEIGIGSRIVSSYLSTLGVPTSTLDINPRLAPDYVGSICDLDEAIGNRKFDLVLCARVLHHLPFDLFPVALRQIANVTSRYAIITLPVDEVRLHFMFRYTSSRIFTKSLRLPKFLKKLTRRWRSRGCANESSLWKVGDSPAHSAAVIRALLAKSFDILKLYQIPEDGSHLVAVLRSRSSRPQAGGA